MLDTELVGVAAQMGSAGLIGMLWLMERRSAGERERQLGEAHERIVEQRSELGVLTGLVESNTRALAGLEAVQCRLARAIERAGYGSGEEG